MKIRKYVARSMPEALQQVRDDLGEQAVILNTRQLRKNSRFNQGDEAHVEVTAAYDEVPALGSGPAPVPTPLPFPTAEPHRAAGHGTPPQQPDVGRPELASEGSRAGGLVAQRYGQARPEIPVPAQLDAPAPGLSPAVPVAPRLATASGVSQPPAEAMESVISELRRVQDALERVGRDQERRHVHVPEAVIRLQARLGSVGLGAELVDAVVAHLFSEMSGKTLDDRARVGERAAVFLARRLPDFKDIRVGRRRKVVGFFGASGAGKTTAVAKIAAGFAARYGRRVIIVCADDRRVGAMDQARAFADIIGVPLEFAYTETAVAEVLERCADARLVLLDAPGCGPHDQQGREGQRRLFAAAHVDEVQVVIDAKSSLEHMLDQIEASAGLGERRLLFTKMDETARSGAVLSAVTASGLSASYFITGPDVPGAIEAGNCGRLAARLMGVSSAATRSGS